MKAPLVKLPKPPTRPGTAPHELSPLLRPSVLEFFPRACDEERGVTEDTAILRIERSRSKRRRKALATVGLSIGVLVALAAVYAVKRLSPPAATADIPTIEAVTHADAAPSASIDPARVVSVAVPPAATTSARQFDEAVETDAPAGPGTKSARAAPVRLSSGNAAGRRKDVSDKQIGPRDLEVRLAAGL